MEHACPSCYSCGMPFKNPSDHALGDVNQQFCAHCVDSNGVLKAYEEILKGTANYLVHSQGLAMQPALQIAKDLLREQPAWRDGIASINMSSARVDLYTLIHKAQRVQLFALATRIGRADFMEKEEISSIAQELRDMITHLRAHSAHETNFIHPLFHQIGDKIAVIEDEHDDLEIELGKLEHILNTQDWKKLYPELNRFIASYLAHQDEEESLQASVLWKYFDDQKLEAVMTAFRKSRTPEQAMEDLKFLIQGMNNLELTALFQKMRIGAPKAAFQAACQIAKEQLEASQWAKLHNSLTLKD